MKRILALDQSSRTSGYAIFEDEKLIKCGHFTFEDEDIGERLYKIRNYVDNLINEYDIEEVIFEDIQMQANVVNNVATFKTLAEVIGVISELLVERKIKYSAVLASVWKSALGIKGAKRPEQKKNAQAYVMTTYGLKPTQDEADAVCIGTYLVNKSIQKEDFDWSE